MFKYVADNLREAVADDNGLHAVPAQERQKPGEGRIDDDCFQVVMQLGSFDPDGSELPFKALARAESALFPGLFVGNPVAVYRKLLNDAVKHVKVADGIVEIEKHLGVFKF